MFKNQKEIIEKFTGNGSDKKTDFLKHENSNFVESLPLLRHNISNHAEEEYLFAEILPKEMKRLYDEGYVYVHDKQLSPYCVSVSCRQLAMQGIPTLAKNMISSSPTRNLDTFLRHCSNLVVLISQQVSGACMLSQMTTIAASYLYYEELNGKIRSDKDLKQLFQSLIWELNMPLRSGSQSSFSNISLEFGKPSEEIKNEYITIGDDFLEIQYKDIPSHYYDRINKAIIDVMAEGTGKNGIPFTFPLITVQIDDDFNFENNLFLELMDKLYYWGGVYFENFKTKPFENEYYKNLNPYIKAKNPEVSRSLCCRLQIDLSLLSRAGGGIFGSSVGSTGAVQVLNMNLNRMLIEFGHDKELLHSKIKEVLNVMQESHQAKRNWLENNKQLFPTFFAFNDNLKNYFNVFAVTGMHEGLINLGYEGGMANLEGKLFAHELMQFITEVINEFIVRDSVACGIEYAPKHCGGKEV